MLTKTAGSEYRSSSSGNRTNGLAYWPEAVQYFLHTNWHRKSRSNRRLRGDPVNANETENSHTSRIVDAAYRCGNIHTDNENISIFCERLTARGTSDRRTLLERKTPLCNNLQPCRRVPTRWRRIESCSSFENKFLFHITNKHVNVSSRICKECY